MAVRNFYVKSDIDGRETPLQGGPKSKDGGMTTSFYQRCCGEITEVIKVVCREVGGELVTSVYHDGLKIHETRTKRD